MKIGEIYVYNGYDKKSNNEDSAFKEVCIALELAGIKPGNHIEILGLDESWDGTKGVTLFVHMQDDIIYDISNAAFGLDYRWSYFTEYHLDCKNPAFSLASGGSGKTVTIDEKYLAYLELRSEILDRVDSALPTGLEGFIDEDEESILYSGE